VKKFLLILSSIFTLIGCAQQSAENSELNAERKTSVVTYFLEMPRHGPVMELFDTQADIKEFAENEAQHLPYIRTSVVKREDFEEFVLYSLNSMPLVLVAPLEVKDKDSVDFIIKFSMDIKAGYEAVVTDIVKKSDGQLRTTYTIDNNNFWLKSDFINTLEKISRQQFDGRRENIKSIRMQRERSGVY